jgi:hypothetical protein
MRGMDHRRESISGCILIRIDVKQLGMTSGSGLVDSHIPINVTISPHL